jgi:hypothetical protein
MIADNKVRQRHFLTVCHQRYSVAVVPSVIIFNGYWNSHVRVYLKNLKVYVCNCFCLNLSVIVFIRVAWTCRIKSFMTCVLDSLMTCVLDSLMTCVLDSLMTCVLDSWCESRVSRCWFEKTVNVDNCRLEVCRPSCSNDQWWQRRHIPWFYWCVSLLHLCIIISFVFAVICGCFCWSAFFPVAKLATFNNMQYCASTRLPSCAMYVIDSVPSMLTN